MLYWVWYEFDYLVDVCCVTKGAHIEGLWLMHEKLGRFLLLVVYILPLWSEKNKFLVNFWNSSIFYVYHILYCVLRVIVTDDCRKLIIKVKIDWSVLPSFLQFFMLILKFMIRNWNVLLLALCAVFGDSETYICYWLCEVQSSKNLLLLLSFESSRNLLSAQKCWQYRDSVHCSGVIIIIIIIFINCKWVDTRWQWSF
jgi:hypothetical protein